MDFALSEAQALLKESLNKYLSSNYTFEQRRLISENEAGFSRDHWSSFAEFGWLTIPFEEEVGGFGGRIEDSAVLMEEFGKRLVLEPYLATVLLAGQLIARSDNAAAIAEILPAIMRGSHISTLAASERQSRQNYSDVLTTATAHNGGYVLNGSKVLVNNGMAAQSLVVTARTDGGQCDRDGISIFLLDADTRGLTRTAFSMMDGTKVANINLDNVELAPGALLGTLNEGSSLLEPVLQEARIAVCAQALGIMDELLQKTIEYSKTREQFGVPIGSFQALQHRMVDMFIGTQQARSMVYRAICEHQQGDSTANTTVLAMKSLVGKYARLIATEAIQLHGGMGMTDELDIGHYVKCAMMINQWFGDSDASLRTFCEQTYR